MSRMLPLLCLLAPLLSSCALIGRATDPTPVPQVVTNTRIVDTGCDWNQPIYISKQDVLTDETAREILEHDKMGVVKCGWLPKNSP